MRKLLIAATLTLCVPVAHAAVPTNPRPLHREGEVLVTYRDVSGPEAARGLKDSLGLVTRKRLIDGRTELLEVPRFTTTHAMLPLLRRDAAVLRAEPNVLRYARAVPNDPLFDEQWGLHSTGQANYASSDPALASIPGADLDMIAAWDSDNNGTFDRIGIPSVIIAIVDDAFHVGHPDLAPVLYVNSGDPAGGGDQDGNGLVDDTSGWDFASDDNDPRPDNASAQSHGTMVAGCAVARGNNNIGVAGTAWNVRYLPLKASRLETRDGAQVGVFDSAAIIEAFDYARLEGAQIVNASFGGPIFTVAERNAVDRLGTAGVLLVAASGNDDSNTDVAQINYPANFALDNVLSVAATNRQDNISSFSQYGAITTDVAAPGLQIVTTFGANGYRTNPGTAGTSFAAPYVAGIAGLIRSVHVGADAAEMKARLIEGAENVGETHLRTAGGRVNAANSLDLVTQPSLVIASVDWTDANGALDPDETTSVDITLHNLWQGATNVQATLSADAHVTVAGGAVDYGNVATDAAATRTFNLTVAGGITGHRYVHFTLAITADNGYSTTRGFIAEIGRLPHDVLVTQTFAARADDLYDEFHAWHYDFAGLPAGHNQLVIETTTSAPGLTSPDLDLLVKKGQPPRYSITVGINPETDSGFFCTTDDPSDSDCLDNAVFMSAGPNGTEQVVIPAPSAGTFHLVIVNFAQLDNGMTYTLRAYTRAGTNPVSGGGGGGGGGGGPLPASMLALLLGAALLRRGLASA
ncbi:MAG TPA: S8 family peptidase [Verrucomicrobiae bacterium]|nr:S8 family peptidase [Verrucomicrobiae bacterium]